MFVEEGYSSDKIEIFCVYSIKIRLFLMFPQLLSCQISQYHYSNYSNMSWLFQDSLPKVQIFLLLLFRRQKDKRFHDSHEETTFESSIATPNKVKKTKKGNYRPVNLLSVLLRLFEKKVSLYKYLIILKRFLVKAL